MRTTVGLLLTAALAVGGLATSPLTPLTPPAAAAPEPGTPAYVERDARNVVAAYGRITEQQLGNPAYLPALVEQSTLVGVAQLLEQAASPTRPSVTPGALVPGWNVGNPLRASWDGTRGRMREVSFTNRYGALLRGTLYAPLRRDARGPFPGVVITEGSVQGSEGMYRWLAQDLAERGYLVLTYDVQGQGTSETLPHDGSPVDALPFCDLLGEPAPGEQTTCPGVPSQQISNFVVGTEDALDFFTSRPGKRYPRHGAAADEVDAFNPWHRLFDRSRDPRPNAPGRTTRIAIVGHSLGAAAVSQVQAYDDRVSTVVALDKLGLEPPSGTDAGSEPLRPVVPALAVQSEYGFTVSPYFTSGGSSITPQPSPKGPDPRRERATGFDLWRDAGVDSMLVVPRASTHLEYTDIPLVLPASRHGQALTSVYVQRWLDHYLAHRTGIKPLLAKRFRYAEPVGGGEWRPVRLRRDPLLSFYYCSAWSLRDGRRSKPDVTGVGC